MVIRSTCLIRVAGVTIKIKVKHTQDITLIFANLKVKIKICKNTTKLIVGYSNNKDQLKLGLMVQSLIWTILGKNR